MNRNVSTMSKNFNFVGDPLLHRVSGIVSSAMTLKEMLDELIGLVLGVTNCDACLVYLLEEAAGEIVLCASQLPHAREIGNIRLKVGEGVTGWVAQHRSPVALASHAASDVRFKSFTSLPEDTYEAFLSVPLINGGRVIGVINVHHKRPHLHTSEEIRLLTYVAEQMGGAIAKASLLEQNAKLVAETLEMKRQLEARKVIERAKGILQRWHGMTEEEAYMDLRSQSRRLRRPMQELADAIILADELHRKSER
ncbi:MAG TPA: GAF domain-containing protein [Terriglobia bacterium]|nr:GAF domain-containing protein [Terriglobia bacterium]